MIAIISTGGTIASQSPDGEAGVEPELSGEQLVAAIPELEEMAEFRVIDFSNIPSPHFSVDQMSSLTELIHKLDDKPSISGIVVTQGTDILEETAYFVDLCYRGQTPIVFTGAMRNPSLPSPDGPTNLVGSVKTVMSNHVPHSKVLVVFNNRVFSARGVTKTNTMNVDTFRNLEFGPLAAIDEDRVSWYRTPTVTDVQLNATARDLSNNVWTFVITADMPPGQIASAEGADAVCFAATGAGHIPETIIEPLESLRAKHIPLVVTSRCIEGRLARGTYAFRGSEQTLRELGCYFSDLNLPKTRIKTILALASDSLDIAFDRPSKKRDT